MSASIFTSGCFFWFDSGLYFCEIKQPTWQQGFMESAKSKQYYLYVCFKQHSKITRMVYNICDDGKILTITCTHYMHKVN